MKLKKLLYLSHPSSGLEENTRDIEKCMRMLYADDEIFNDFCIISPVHNTGFMYHDVDYNKGLQFCIDLLLHCDIMLVIGDYNKSRGCKKEIEVCKKEQIPCVYVDNSEMLEQVLKEKHFALTLINECTEKDTKTTE